MPEAGGGPSRSAGFRLRLERMSGGRGDWWAVEAPPRMPLQVAVACLHLATTNHTLWPACPLVATTLGERGGGLLVFGLG